MFEILEHFVYLPVVKAAPCKKGTFVYLQMTTTTRSVGADKVITENKFYFLYVIMSPHLMGGGCTVFGADPNGIWVRVGMTLFCLQNIL